MAIPQGKASKKSVPPQVRRSPVWPLVLIAALGFLVYGNSLRGQFVWDDDVLIKDNVTIKQTSNIGRVWTQNIEAGAGRMTNSYRPVVILTFMVNYALGQLSPVGYHVANILFHVLAGWALYWFIHLLFQNVTLAFLTSIFFIVHPVHTEAVSYISGRSDPLALFFLLIAFIYYVKQKESLRPSYCFAMASAYALGLFARESTLILPVLLIFYHRVFEKKFVFRKFSVILGVTVFYLVLRVGLSGVLPGAVVTTTFLQRTPGFFAAVTDYIRLLVVPLGLHMEYGMPIFSWTAPKVIVGFVFVCFCLLSIRYPRAPKLVRFAVGWFFLTLLPVANIFPVNAYMAEHWLYLPSIGFFFLLARWISSCLEAGPGRSAVMAAAVALLAFYGALTIRQNVTWNDPLRFYERTLQFNSTSSRVLTNLGTVYQSRGEDAKAISLYKKAIEINPKTEVRAYNNLGLIYENAGKSEEAIAWFKKAVALNSALPEVYNNLGTAHMHIGKPAEAASFFKKALELNPQYAQARINLTSLGQDQQTPEATIALYEEAVRLDPYNAEGYYNLGNFYLKLGRFTEAIPVYQKAVGINPKFFLAYNNLGLAYKGCRKFDDAIEAFRKVINLDPGYQDAANNLGVTYNAAGRKKEAVAVFEDILQYDVHNARAYKNLAVVYYEMGDFASAIRFCDKAVAEGGRVPPDFLKALESYRR
jgi:tetratricopeptide (TPR) repeat protein